MAIQLLWCVCLLLLGTQIASAESFLASWQGADGGWREVRSGVDDHTTRDDSVETTALVLRAYLRVHRSRRLDDQQTVVVKKALRWLGVRQNADGSFGTNDRASIIAVGAMAKALAFPEFLSLGRRRRALSGLEWARRQWHKGSVEGDASKTIGGWSNDGEKIDVWLSLIYADMLMENGHMLSEREHAASVLADAAVMFSELLRREHGKRYVRKDMSDTSVDLSTGAKTAAKGLAHEQALFRLAAGVEIACLGFSADGSKEGILEVSGNWFQQRFAIAGSEGVSTADIACARTAFLVSRGVDAWVSRRVVGDGARSAGALLRAGKYTTALKEMVRSQQVRAGPLARGWAVTVGPESAYRDTDGFWFSRGPIGRTALFVQLIAEKWKRKDIDVDRGSSVESGRN